MPSLMCIVGLPALIAASLPSPPCFLAHSLLIMSQGLITKPCLPRIGDGARLAFKSPQSSCHSLPSEGMLVTMLGSYILFYPNSAEGLFFVVVFDKRMGDFCLDALSELLEAASFSPPVY